jgi:hypothetical protein
MQWSEWLLLGGVIFVLIFVSAFVRKKIQSKARLWISLISFVALMVFFIASRVKDRFTTIQLLVLIAFVLVWLISFYGQYKEIAGNKPR